MVKANLNQPWPTVNRVIDFEKFVSIRKRADNPNKYENCLILAKEQLGKVGLPVLVIYQVSKHF